MTATGVAGLNDDTKSWEYKDRCQTRLLSEAHEQGKDLSLGGDVKCPGGGFVGNNNRGRAPLLSRTCHL